MMSWLALLGLLAITIAGLLLPLFRRPAPAASRADGELALRRDQLREIRQDRDRGLLSQSEAEAAELEISRQLLSAASRATAEAARPLRPTGGANRLVAVTLALFVPLSASLLYWTIGAPALIGTQSAPDSGLGALAAEHDGQDMHQAAARLIQRLENDPANREAWVLLGRTYATLQRFDLAVEAYRRAVALSESDGVLTGNLAETLVFATGGIVSPEARSLFERSLAALPGDPRSRYYLAVAVAQDGKSRAALDGWLALEADSPPDAPWLPALRQQIEQTASQAGIDLATLGPRGPADSPATASAPALGAQQLEMVRGMVSGLAARLEQEPDDLEGWLRLARSYHVLGEPARAREALTRAAPLEATATAEQRAILVTLRGEVGGPPAVPRAEPAAAARNALTTAAAAPGEPDQHAEMIQAMVAGLATRLEAQPDDPKGWRLLGRSYTALGQLEGARAAYGEAVKRDPENLALLQDYAQILLELAEPTPALPAPSLRILRNLLDIDDRDPGALWLVGLAERDGGNPATAAELWRRLLAGTDPAAPRHDRIKAALEALPSTP